MTAPNHAASERPDDAARLTGRERRDSLWEAALDQLAEQAARSRDVALHLIADHVDAITEIVRARVAERGGNADTEIASLIEALRVELNTALDRTQHHRDAA